MQPWQTIERATAPDGAELVLARRGDEWVVRAAGHVLMSSRVHGSEDALAKYEPGEISAVVAGPLGRIQFEPRTVLVYGNSAQVMRLLNACLFEKGGSIKSEFSGRGDCADIVIRGKRSAEPQLVLPCYGDRIFGHAADDEMAFTFPWSARERIVKGLEGTHAGGIRYPIPVYQRFQPEFPKSYQELERIWQEGGES